MRIIIVGAGLSGLTAGWRLQQAGHEVVVLEKASIAGGRCKALRQDGYLIDTCPELVASSYRHWLALAREMGLADAIVPAPSAFGVVRDGCVHELDPARPFKALTTPLLSAGAKLRVAAAAWRLRKQIASVPPFLLDGDALDDAHRSAMDVAQRLFGQEASQYLLGAMLRPIGGTRMDYLSTLLVPYLLSEWTQTLSVRGGLDRVPLAVAQRLDVRYEHDVVAVEQVTDAGAPGVTIRYRQAGGSAQLHADRCIIATQYHDALAMYPPLRAKAPAYEASADYLQMIDVKLAYRKRPKTSVGMVMCPFDELGDVNLISLSHNKCDDRAPKAHALFSVFTEHLRYAQMAAMRDEDIIRAMRLQVERLFPEVSGSFLFAHVFRQPRTCMLPTPGFFKRTRVLWEAFGPADRVQLAGDIFNFGSLEAAVSSGDYVAERILQGI